MYINCLYEILGCLFSVLFLLRVTSKVMSPFWMFTLSATYGIFIVMAVTGLYRVSFRSQLDVLRSNILYVTRIIHLTREDLKPHNYRIIYEHQFISEYYISQRYTYFRGGEKIKHGVSHMLFILSMIKEVVLNFPFIYSSMIGLNILVNQV